MEQGKASVNAFRWVKAVKTTGSGVVWQASAAIDPSNSKILRDVSVGKASSGGNKQQVDAGYLDVRLGAVDLLLSKLFAMYCSTEGMSRALL